MRMISAPTENERTVTAMAEYIECRNCESPDCKVCNIKNLETMLKNGKFDCLMNENRCVNPSADVATVRHGRWKCHGDCGVTECSVCGWSIEEYVGDYAYCPNCGAKMDAQNIMMKRTKI